MKWSEQRQLENESKIAFRALLPKEWIVREKNPDIGIDLEIEFVKGEEVENRLLWVQLKGTKLTRLVKGIIPFRVETKHLKYYENSQLPIIILLWRKSENAFYCLFAQRWIKEELSMKDPEWRMKKTKTIGFSAKSKLTDVNNLRDISTEGYFYIIQQHLNITPEAGSAVYWLDGIPKSDDEELKNHVYRALSLLAKDEFQEAIQELEETLRICAIGPKQKIAILLSLGNAYYSLSDFTLALKYFSAANLLTAKVSEVDALVGKSFALGNIGLIYTSMGDFDSAQKYQEEALNLALRTGDKKGQATVLSNLSFISRLKGDIKSALKQNEESLRIEQEIGSKAGEAASLCNIGVIYEETGELDIALKYFKQGLEIGQRIGFRKCEANALANIGLILFGKGDEKEALEYYNRALKITKDLGDKRAEAETLSNMGLIFRNSDEALEFFQRSLELERQIGDKRGEATALGNIGLFHLVNGGLEKAILNFTAALKIDEAIDYKRGIATDLSDIGMFYKAKGDLQNAINYFEKALAIDRQIGSIKGEIDDLHSLGDIYLDMGKPLSALKKLINALAILNERNLSIGREEIEYSIDQITNMLPLKSPSD